MANKFAYVAKVRHEFLPRMWKKGRWRATCTCLQMLEKRGSLKEVDEAWVAHIREEGARREATPLWSELSMNEL